MGDMAEGWDILKEERRKYKEGNRNSFRKVFLTHLESLTMLGKLLSINTE